MRSFLHKIVSKLHLLTGMTKLSLRLQIIGFWITVPFIWSSCSSLARVFKSVFKAFSLSDSCSVIFVYFLHLVCPSCLHLKTLNYVHIYQPPGLLPLDYCACVNSDDVLYTEHLFSAIWSFCFRPHVRVNGVGVAKEHKDVSVYSPVVQLSVK